MINLCTIFHNSQWYSSLLISVWQIQSESSTLLCVGEPHLLHQPGIESNPSDVRPMTLY